MTCLEVTAQSGGGAQDWVVTVTEEDTSLPHGTTDHTDRTFDPSTGTVRLGPNGSVVVPPHLEDLAREKWRDFLPRLMNTRQGIFYGGDKVTLHCLKLHRPPPNPRCVVFSSRPRV